MSFIMIILAFSLTGLAQSTVKLFKSNMNYEASTFGRDVYVYLPDGYNKNSERYSVLYMQDGQNLFDPSRAYLGHTWNVQSSLDELIKNKMIPPIIVVAVDNTSERMDEYIPGVRGAAYLDFIAYELKPLVDQAFKTNPQRLSTAIMGSSLGGLISLQAGMSHFQTFGLVGALSPSIWWNERAILNAYRLTKFLPEKVYLDSGTQGGELPGDVEDLSQVLLMRNFNLNKTLLTIVQDGADHSEHWWALRFPKAVTFLFQREDLQSEDLPIKFKHSTF